MDSVSANIVLGVVSGVITSAVLALCVRIFQTTVVPWVQERIYGGISVEGEWNGQRKDGDVEYNFQLVVEQVGSRLSGIFLAVDKFPDRVTTRSFALSGILHGTYAVLTYFPTTRSTVGGGAFVLQLLEGGDRLSGAMSYIRTKTGTVQAKDDISLVRKSR